MAKSKFTETAAEKFLSQKLPQKQESKTGIEPKKSDVKLSQRGYYITDEQYKKIKLLAVEKDTDTSSIVREAIDKYFNIIKL